MDDEKLEEVATQLINALDDNGMKEVAQTLALIKSKRKIASFDECPSDRHKRTHAVISVSPP